MTAVEAASAEWQKRRREKVIFDSSCWYLAAYRYEF
jgi:hypothetical protein